ncbi:golgi reassembly stacking protein 1 [Phyllostomus discolor]|uniref:Golgi reassembly stacking protein 1 n=1 Tax=Phyllostomus discolor TaxID=89673 RepID=A0A834E0I4_9CHIR|nr:golgi reassembly stacking protein 1 [Phyllostomus discolor]
MPPGVERAAWGVVSAMDICIGSQSSPPATTRSHLVPCHPVPHHMVPHHLVPHHLVPHYLVSCNLIPCNLVPHHLVPHHKAPGSSSAEGLLPEPASLSYGAPDLGGLPRPMETPLQPPPPVQRVMDPGFLDVSGISVLDSSAGVWPGLPSFPGLTSTAASASGLEDMCSSSGSHERGGEATWSGSEFEVSFPDSPGAQAQQDHLPQLTLPDSLTSAASPEDGLSAELLEAQAEEEPANVASPDVGAGAEAEGAAGRAQLPTPE